MAWNIHIVREADPDHRIAFMANSETAEADARLIISAHNMRAALEQIAAEQKVYLGHGDYTIEPALSAEKAQSAARAAIAAAEGAAP